MNKQDQLAALGGARPAPGLQENHHQWDAEGERCIKCGDRDWFAGEKCEGKAPKLQCTTDTYRQIENDDWIEWGGTDGCPVEAEATVIVRLTNPRDTLQAKAGEFEWSSDKANDPITAYRVIENDGREG